MFCPLLLLPYHARSSFRLVFGRCELWPSTLDGWWYRVCLGSGWTLQHMRLWCSLFWWPNCICFFVHFGGQGFLVGVFYFQVILFVHGDVNYISISIYIFSQYLVMLSYMKPLQIIKVWKVVGKLISNLVFLLYQRKEACFIMTVNIF